jgi:glycosyltransferase involved in cell wall biosynthesis
VTQTQIPPGTLPSAGPDALTRPAEPELSIDVAEVPVADRPLTIHGTGNHDGHVLPQPTLDISIIVPFYNPGDRLRTTVERLVRVLEASGLSFEIIAVSDGSNDGSPLTLEEFPESVVRRVSYASNVGKGYAVRTGLGMGRGRYLGFIDADGDISPDFVTAFVAIMRAQGPDIVIGSKRHPDSSVRSSTLRRLYSAGHQSLNRILFRLEVRDTQVGIKLVDRRVVADVLPLLREDRFALDLEFLVLAQRLGYVHVVEAPVCIEERSDSTVSMKSAWRLVKDTVGIYVRLSVRHEYDCGIASRVGSGAEGPVVIAGSVVG